MVRAALDSNILVYAEGEGDETRCNKARDLVDALPSTAVTLPVQVVGETYNVLTRKYSWTPTEARNALLVWTRAYERAATTDSAMLNALQLAGAETIAIWDAVILSAAQESGCSLLISEDMQDGFVWRGVTVVNPFVSSVHPMLAQLLRP